MIDKERDKEFRKAFFFLKRYIKSPLGITYTHGYSRGSADIEPAKEAYAYVLQLQEESTSFEEKFNTLQDFLEKEYNERQEQRPSQNTGRYWDYIGYIKDSKRKIENGEPVQTRRKK
ncbi:TPA: hypothetical protein QCX91_002203 [Bacillus thuringiensis]|uniref:hypothetical protein n=1 Tax=Bacillus sp. CH_70 TaxID=2978215 RepID=UPI0030F6EDC1|nr:hypothetical protein [Bacillus thuringiensis]